MPPKSKRTASEASLYRIVQEAISPLREDIARLDKKTDMHIQETKFGFSEVARTDAQQNELLKEHHDRSVQLKRDNDLREKTLLETEIKPLKGRVDVLEAPGKWWGMTWKGLLTLGTIAAGVLVLLQILGKR